VALAPLKPTKCLGPGFPVFSDRIFLGKYKHPNSTTIVSHYSFNQWYVVLIKVVAWRRVLWNAEDGRELQGHQFTGSEMQYPAIWGKIIQYSGECKVHETHDFS
jgi:hypothetical protein